jgi:hypothetical protein
MWPFSKRSTLDVRALERRLPRHVAAVLTAAGVPRFREALPRMVMELERARRYGRPLTIALHAVAPTTAAGNGAGGGHGDHAGVAQSDFAAADPFSTALLGSMLRELVREIDIVAYSAALSRCTVVMPEIGQPEARLATRRLRDMCSARLAMPIRAEVAVFPEDGVTLEELITLVEARSHVVEPPPALRSVHETIY